MSRSSKNFYIFYKAAAKVKEKKVKRNIKVSVLADESENSITSNT
jgi:hypothetical protein